jgi:hypothetical protein
VMGAATLAAERSTKNSNARVAGRVIGWPEILVGEHRCNCERESHLRV